MSVENTVVFINEEYGYRHWRWVCPGNLHNVMRVFKEKMEKSFCWTADSGLPGTISLIETQEEYDALQDEYEAYIHWHQDDDTFIHIGGAETRQMPELVSIEVVD